MSDKPDLGRRELVRRERDELALVSSAFVARGLRDIARIEHPKGVSPTITPLSDEPDTDSSAPISVPTPPKPSFVPSGNLAAKVRSAQADAAAKHAQARQLVNQKYDYAGAVSVLEGIPETLRGRGFYDDCVSKRDRVVVLKKQINQLAQAKQYLEAAPLAEELFQLQPNRADIQQVQSKLVEKVNAARQLAETTHAVARKQADEEFDFVAAVQTLESIPQQLRDTNLLQEYAFKRDRVVELEELIGTGVETNRLHGLRPLVEELLGLQTYRDDLRELLDALPTSEEPMSSGVGTVINVKIANGLIPAATEYLRSEGKLGIENITMLRLIAKHAKDTSKERMRRFEESIRNAAREGYRMTKVPSKSEVRKWLVTPDGVRFAVRHGTKEAIELNVEQAETVVDEIDEDSYVALIRAINAVLASKDAVEFDVEIRVSGTEGTMEACFKELFKDLL